MLNFVPTSQNFINAVKEISVAKLCEVIGIRCKYNYESSFFNFFANVTGQAICEILQIPITIADAKYRLVRYNRVNLVEQTIKLLQEFELEECFIEIFNLIPLEKKNIYWKMDVNQQMMKLLVG